MKNLIMTILLAFSLTSMADYSSQLKQESQIRRDNAKKIYDLKSKQLKEQYEAQLQFFDKIEALAAKMEPGNKENNKKIREEMKSMRKAFKEEQKSKRKAFHENEIKPLKKQAKEERKARKKKFRKEMKAQKNKSN